jgi:hypothetical protein
VVKNQGNALQYTSLKLQNNYKIIIEAVKNRGDTSLELRNNYKNVIESVKIPI